MTDPDPHVEGRLAASIESLRHEFDRWLGFAVDQGERALEVIRARGEGGPWSPPIDIIERPDEIHVLVDLPGVDPEAVDVSLAGNMLTIRGEKPVVAFEGEQTSHIRERSRGSFSRSIPMPTPVNSDAVSAESQIGVLRIRLGKSELAKCRRIQVATQKPDQPSEHHEHHGG